MNDHPYELPEGEGPYVSVARDFSKTPGATSSAAIRGLPGESLKSWAASCPQAMRDRGKKNAEAVRQVIYLLELGERIGAAIGQIAAEEGLSVGTLRRWYDRARRYPPTSWEAALTPGWKGRRASPISPIVWDCFLYWYWKMPTPQVARAWRRTQEVAASKGWGEIASAGIFRRRLKKSVL